MGKLAFNKTYFLLFVLLFIIETLIAIYFKDGFIRHTFGDYLVVILIYCFIKSLIDIEPLKLGIAVLLFAFTIELLQLANILSVLNLQDNQLVKLVLGSTFQITDLIAYTLGVITVILIEYKIYKLWID